MEEDCKCTELEKRKGEQSSSRGTIWGDRRGGKKGGNREKGGVKKGDRTAGPAAVLRTHRRKGGKAGG